MSQSQVKVNGSGKEEGKEGNHSDLDTMGMDWM
jgi:hypothetical protein